MPAMGVIIPITIAIAIHYFLDKSKYVFWVTLLPLCYFPVGLISELLQRAKSIKTGEANLLFVLILSMPIIASYGMCHIKSIKQSRKLKYILPLIVYFLGYGLLGYAFLYAFLG